MVGQFRQVRSNKFSDSELWISHHHFLLSSTNGAAVDPSGRFSARSVSNGVVGNHIYYTPKTLHCFASAGSTYLGASPMPLPACSKSINIYFA
jgi:hypothetical protein